MARPVGRKEIQSTPKAEESLATEWDRLRAIRTWDEKGVQEYSDVIARLNESGETAATMFMMTSAAVLLTVMRLTALLVC